MVLRLVPATATDRKRIARIRAPIGMGHFVHFNWFWLDRALADPEIQLSLILGGSRGGVTGCLAYGPHEPVDLVPSSRMPGVGEIYHIVIDRKQLGKGKARRPSGPASKRFAPLIPSSRPCASRTTPTTRLPPSFMPGSGL